MNLQEMYRPNMRLLAEALEREYIAIEFYDRRDSARYKGINVYYEGINFQSDMVYLIRAEEWKQEFAKEDSCGFVILGRLPLEQVPAKRSAVLVLETVHQFRVLEILQALFRLFGEWNRNLQAALNTTQPLQRIVEASEMVFRNPVFIHDSYFYVLAWSEQLKSLNIWETDRKTGRRVVSSQIRNDFQLDQEYLEGLSARKTVLFSANQRGYQILYHNLYSENRYIGRVLVDEIQNLLQIGDYDVMEYLAGFLQETIQIKGLLKGDHDGQMDHELRKILRGEKGEDQSVLKALIQRDWKQDDAYRCLKLNPSRPEAYLVSNTAIMDRLQVLLPNSYSLLFDESVVVILNMSENGRSIQEMVAGLAVFLRDNLIQIGISTEYRDFFLLQGGYKQASVALEQGKKSGSMYWYHYFEEYLVEYAGDVIAAQMPQEMMISEALNTLKRYDEENHTELFQTLKVYLRQERNLLQTAKQLFIHRSTLSYRIERIRAITGVNLDQEKERLRLLLSFVWEEGRRS